jgi:dienelactone hydrolase
LKRLLVALLCGGVAVQAGARRLEAVTFPSVERDAAGATLMLQGVLLLPARTTPAGGFPAIIALHGCGGMYSAREGHDADVAERLLLRVEPWVRDGYAVLFADSFGPRGFRNVCTIPHGEPTVTATTRRLDALGALAYLAARRDIARERIALVGWSHGGSAALQAINTGDRTIALFFARQGAPPFFRAAVAFYPGCATPLKAGERYRPGTPTRVHIGELDDWTPAQTCVDLGTALQARGADFNVTTYPNSYHAFDSPTGKVVHRTDVPNGVRPGHGVHVGPNPTARESANASVAGFLRERLSPW